MHSITATSATRSRGRHMRNPRGAFRIAAFRIRYHALCAIAGAVVSAYACVAQTPVAHLADYHAIATFTSDREANVAAAIRLQPDALPPRLVIVRYPEQQIEQLALRNGEGAVSFKTVENTDALVVQLTAAQQASSAPLEVQ